MKRLRGVLIVFALILTVSVVYAVGTSGVFEIGGTVKISGVRLVVDTDVKTDNLSKVELKSTGTSIEVEIDWDENDGDEVVFTFELKNAGSFDAAFTVEDTEYGDEVENGEITATCELESGGKTGIIIAGESETFTVTVTRDSDAIGEFSFKIIINYVKTP